MHTHTRARTHTHTHTRRQAGRQAAGRQAGRQTGRQAGTLYRLIGAKDNFANVLSLFFKKGRVAECLMSWGRLLQMWGPKCEKVRKPGVLRLKRWSLKDSTVYVVIVPH